MTAERTYDAVVTEIVRTRLRPPRPVAARIARPRAAAAFAEAADVPLVCVEADAGYGKTTLVDAVTTGAHRAWYALTPRTGIRTPSSRTSPPP